VPILSTPKKRHYKMTQLQQEILRHVARGEESSKSTISKALHKNYPNVNDSVERLVRNGYLIQRGERQVIGKKQKFYVLTDSSIEELIKLKISLEDFWKMMFVVFDSRKGHELKEMTADKAFSIYERDTLGYSTRYVPTLYDWALENIANLIGTDQHYYARRIIFLLGQKGSLTHKQIVKKMVYNRNDESSWISRMIEFLLSKMLIYEIEHKNSTKYRLTHFGLILLFNEIYEKNKSKIKKESDSSIIKLIIDNYHDSLPRIFGNWRLLCKITTEVKLLHAFRMLLYPMDGIFGHPIQNGGLYEIMNTPRLMSKASKNKLEMEIRAGRRYWKEWAKNNPDQIGTGIPRKKWDSISEDEKNKVLDFSNTISSIDLLCILFPDKYKSSSPVFAVLKKFGELSLKNISDRERKDAKLLRDGLDLLNKDESFRKSIDNTISFQFYSVLIHQIKIMVISIRFLDFLKKVQDDRIRKAINTVYEKWDLFLSRNGDFEEWYKNWMKEIIRFTKQNIEIMQELETMPIQDLDIKRTGDADLMERLLHIRV